MMRRSLACFGLVGNAMLRGDHGGNHIDTNFRPYKHHRLEHRHDPEEHVHHEYNMDAFASAPQQPQSPKRLPMDAASVAARGDAETAALAQQKCEGAKGCEGARAELPGRWK
jgi:hypothetical protein